MNEVDKLRLKIAMLHREESPYYGPASAKEAIDVLQECIMFLLNIVDDDSCDDDED